MSGQSRDAEQPWAVNMADVGWQKMCKIADIVLA